MLPLNAILCIFDRLLLTHTCTHQHHPPTLTPRIYKYINQRLICPNEIVVRNFLEHYPLFKEMAKANVLSKEEKTNRFLRRARSRVPISLLPFRYSGCVSSSSFKCSITRLLSYDDIKLVRLVNWKMPKRSMNDENTDYSRI